MTKLTTNVVRETAITVPRGGKDRALIIEARANNFVMRVKGTQEAYYVDWGRLFAIVRASPGLSETLPSEEVKRPVRRSRKSPPSPVKVYADPEVPSDRVA